MPNVETGRLGRILLRCFCLFLLAVGCYHLLRWPIAGTDTDLWYHLNGGRYFFETGSIAGTSFFSFIVPERLWVNYYWLFQIIVHHTFSWSGYTGLIVFRTTLFCATLLMVFFYLFKGQEDYDALVYYTLLFVFYFLLFLPRSLPVRPHLFSYLLIVTFLYLLELGPRWALYLLVPLGVLWANLHGVEYPVMLLILGAYCAKFVYDQVRGEPRQRTRGSGSYGVLAFAAASILCTPHGIKLLAVPFRSTAFVSQFMYELRPLTLYDFISFFGILFLLAILTAASAIRKKSVSIAHLLLLAGGVLLLLKGKRFVNEFALLSLPLLRAHIPALTASPRIRIVKPIARALILAFMLMPFFFMQYFFANPPRYPLSARELPEGVTMFLKRARTAGPILNHPNTGGYLEWELYPEHKIFMDMQVPFLFTDEDFRLARGAYAEQRVLGGLILQYRPPFITAPIDMAGFKALIEQFPQYRLVFFDDAEVLYVDRFQQTALAEAYEIRFTDPFALYGGDDGGSRLDEPRLRELLRLSKMHQSGGIVNAAIATVYQRQGRYREAIPYAESIISTYPESHLGYKLKANALSRLEACDEAIPLYRKALQRSDGPMKELIEKEASSCEKR